ncbi:ABC transporter permease [Celeribacter litoreus]|uniref:ABC transporter permease n=1 Tax=Celeribacter litoreus TaxID=2876714 RepID=UPI001CCE30CB|nr:ABC transporter permease [Celeribacter litoreus]MCA0042076.1 ABC transporter permease [Celeribacter litoreus]
MMRDRCAPSSWVTFRVIFALILREISTTYGRSPGGYIWAILEPVLGIALLTIIFSLFLRAPPLGESFPLFYATGILPFTLYSDVSNKISRSISFSRPLLFYPRVTFLDAILARAILATLTSVTVMGIILCAIVMLEGIDLRLDPMLLGLGIAMPIALGFGIGSLNALLFAIAPAWERVWAILNRPMFLISGIFYLFTSLPEAIQKLLWFNPLIHITGALRGALYDRYQPDYVSPSYVFLLSLIFAVLGILFLKRFNKLILNDL